MTEKLRIIKLGTDKPIELLRTVYILEKDYKKVDEIIREFQKTHKDYPVDEIIKTLEEHQIPIMNWSVACYTVPDHPENLQF